uniref:Uncharacterized protein n=1 Tax=Romanomermis culicivorax TaxID=13658 RepID=A0A915J7U2_ROMCU
MAPNGGSQMEAKDDFCVKPREGCGIALTRGRNTLSRDGGLGSDVTSMEAFWQLDLAMIAR